ncbi:hypothetical protein AMJ80_06660 [bacterium SM23_31]|nr:MAG: hypothetical protein AMJ80_06660 [bacterium SM23_31]
MQTVIYREIKGYNIITGFGKLSIDPAETKKAIAPLIAEDSRIKRIGDLTTHASTVRKAIAEIMKVVRVRIPAVPNRKETGQLEKYAEQIRGIESELVDIEAYRKKRIEQLTRERPVYFEPTRYEIAKTDEEIQRLSEEKGALHPAFLLDVDGNHIPNFTGRVFWVYDDGIWEKATYDFGEQPPVVAIEEKDLNAAQRAEISQQLEAQRVQALTVQEKEAEKARAVNELANKAVMKRQGLEIQGIPSEDALTQAREWYNEQILIIDEKYN